MAINKKSLVSKASTKNSATTKSKSAAAKPVTPGKMVPAMKLAKLQATRASVLTTRAMID